MNKVFLPIRIVLIVVCAAAGYGLSYTAADWNDYRMRATFIGFSIGVLIVLVDIMLKGFSLRGMSGLTFGLGIGTLVSYFIGNSPLFKFTLPDGSQAIDAQTLFLSQLGLFIATTYLCTVIALRGKDEFNLVIPYVRFVPHEVDVPLVVIDTSVLIDGRIGKLCESGFLSAALIIPRFVLQELQEVADSTDQHRQARGRRGLEILNELRKIKNIDIRITESEVTHNEHVDAKLVFLAQSMRAKLMTTDFNLGKLAEFHGVTWLNLNTLAKSLRPELLLGDSVEVDLIKPGREDGQAVGYLEDGSMVVVNSAKSAIGKRVHAEIISVLPSAGGKMVFAKLTGTIQ